MTTPRRLPVWVPLVPAETLDSYLARVATANHLDPGQLRTHLGMRTRRAPPDLDRLAGITGHPAHQLAGVLADARPPPGRNRLAPLTGRIACRRCTARRGITDDVYCAAVDQRVCRRHRHWLGGPLDNTADQYDLTALPDVLHAQRRHYRLLHRHGADHGRIAIHWASNIIERWTQRGDWAEHRQRRLAAHRAAHAISPEPDASLLAMANYPEIVTLAAVIASPHWSAIAGTNDRGDRLPFELEVARRLGIPRIGFPPTDPLVNWEEGEAHVRRLDLNRQPGNLESETWLAGAG